MYDYILDYLPYKSSFRFVDKILSINMSEVKGEYTLKKDAYFYEDHFPGFPVTPGVIITEIMAQIGLVVPGIYMLLKDIIPSLRNEQIFDSSKSFHQIIPLLNSIDVSFHKMTYPGEKLIVVAKKEYFRQNKLKSYVEMTNGKQELVAKGIFSGILHEHK